MDTRILTVLLVALLPVFPSEAVPYTGRVFDDRNGNGIWDEGDTALAGVCVSDGLNVAETSGDGLYSLPGHASARFISVTVPSGYMARRHYCRAGDGGPCDFAMSRYDAWTGRRGEHRFIQVTDTEISDVASNEGWTGDVRRYAAVEKAAFVIHTGDICYEKGLKAHAELMNTENMGIPVYYSIGNHDLVDGACGEELFESLYGPVWYSFNVAGTHYIVLPMLSGDRKPGYTADDVCAWMENDLSHVDPGTPLIVFCHDLLSENGSFVYNGCNGSSVDLSLYNLRAWVYGHYHTDYVRRYGNVLSVSTPPASKGGIDHSPAAFRVFRTDADGNVSTELRYPGIGHHVRIASPKGKCATDRIVVNAYSSSSYVEYVEYACLYKGMPAGRSGKAVQMTDWSWTGGLRLPARYAGRELTLRVEVVFSDGSAVTAEEVFTYEPELGALACVQGDWPCMRGNPSHTASGMDLGDSLSLVWAANAGGNIFMASPVVHDGKVCVASSADGQESGPCVCAFDSGTGRLLWKYRTRAAVKGSLAAEGGRIFAQDVYGWLYSLDSATGSLEWECRLPVNDGHPPLMDGLVAGEGTVYAGSGKGLSAYVAADGRMLWRNDGWSQGEGTVATLSLGGGMLIGSAQWRSLYGNDAGTGKLLWSRADSGLNFRAASAAVYGERLYVTSGRRVFMIDIADGETVMERELPFNLDVASSPVVAGGCAVFGTADSGVVGTDAGSLEPEWNMPVGNALILTAPYTRHPVRTVEAPAVLCGDTLFVGASDGNMYSLDPVTGKKLWSYDFGAPVLGPAAVSGNMLFVSDFGGNVYAFTIGR